MFSEVLYFFQDSKSYLCSMLIPSLGVLPRVLKSCITRVYISTNCTLTDLLFCSLDLKLSPSSSYAFSLLPAVYSSQLLQHVIPLFSSKAQHISRQIMLEFDSYYIVVSRKGGGKQSTLGRQGIEVFAWS